MLGSMVVQVLARNPSFAITATTRGSGPQAGVLNGSNVRWETVDFATGELPPGLVERHEWIVNAVGITKPLIQDDNPADVARAINLNARLPQAIADAASRSGCRVLQIATDCVYSGLRGSYIENDPHDALDVYGKTKSLGEAYSPSEHHLRCSIIGPEPKDFKFLFEWFRGRPRDARIDGYRNHRWNGVTTLQFARLCAGIIEQDLPLGHLQHVIPAGSVTKAELLSLMGVVFGRGDIEITSVDAKAALDRTLATMHSDGNARLWTAAGYAAAPTMEEMLHELCAFPYRAAGPAVA